MVAWTELPEIASMFLKNPSGDLQESDFFFSFFCAKRPALNTTREQEDNMAINKKWFNDSRLTFLGTVWINRFCFCRFEVVLCSKSFKEYFELLLVVIWQNLGLA